MSEFAAVLTFDRNRQEKNRMSADQDRLSKVPKQKKNSNQIRKWADPVAAGGHVADWNEVNPDYVIAAVSAVAAMGGALRLGYTRDGGAYSIGVYGDGEPFTLYAKPDGEIDGVLQRIYETYSS